MDNNPAKIANLGIVWKDEIFNHADAVDSDADRDWEDLAYGYALGNGFTPDEAFEFTVFLHREGWI